jgi:hypothetical protein
MMRTLIALLALAALPAAASAQTVENGRGRLDLSGTAPSACIISAPTSVTGSNASLQESGPQTAQITIGQLADPTTAEPKAASINLALPIICNTAHTLTVTSANGGLVRVGGNASNVTNGFREFLPYQVDVLWAGRSATWSGRSVAGGGADRAANVPVGDGAAGQLSLTIAVPPGGAPLIAGAYADSVVIQLQVAS